MCAAQGTSSFALTLPLGLEAGLQNEHGLLLGQNTGETTVVQDMTGHPRCAFRQKAKTGHKTCR